MLLYKVAGWMIDYIKRIVISNNSQDFSAPNYQPFNHIQNAQKCRIIKEYKGFVSKHKKSKGSYTQLIKYYLLTKGFCPSQVQIEKIVMVYWRVIWKGFIHEFMLSKKQKFWHINPILVNHIIKLSDCCIRFNSQFSTFSIVPLHLLSLFFIKALFFCQKL